MTHPQSTHRLPSFDPDVLIDELYCWPLSLQVLGNETFCFLLTRIRNCGHSIVIEGNIYPDSKHMKELKIFEGLMNQLIALGDVPAHVIRNYSRLMEIIIRTSLADESLKFQEREYKARLKLIPYLD